MSTEAEAYRKCTVAYAAAESLAKLALLMTSSEGGGEADSGAV
jgi:hypothetical protein